MAKNFFDKFWNSVEERFPQHFFIETQRKWGVPACIGLVPTEREMVGAYECQVKEARSYLSSSEPTAPVGVPRGRQIQLCVVNDLQSGWGNQGVLPAAKV